MSIIRLYLANDVTGDWPTAPVMSSSYMMYVPLRTEGGLRTEFGNGDVVRLPSYVIARLNVVEVRWAQIAGGVLTRWGELTAFERVLCAIKASTYIPHAQEGARREWYGVAAAHEDSIYNCDWLADDWRVEVSRWGTFFDAYDRYLHHFLPIKHSKLVEMRGTGAGNTAYVGVM